MAWAVSRMPVIHPLGLGCQLFGLPLRNLEAVVLREQPLDLAGAEAQVLLA